MDFLTKFDILFIQETRSTDELYLDNYHSCTKRATPSQRGGRPKGGLALLFSMQIQANITQLPSNDEWSVAAVLDFGQVKLLCINLYLPTCRRQTQVEQLWKEVEAYVVQWRRQHPSAMILLAGDLNARVGPNNNALYTHFHHWPPETEIIPPLMTRSSYDKTCNMGGLHLAQMAYRQNLHLLNGAIQGDYPGQYTYWSGHKLSVIDYCIVSQDLIPRISKFTITARAESDHLSLSLVCDLPFDLPKPQHRYQPELTPGTGFKKIRWNGQVSERISNWYKSEESYRLSKAIMEGCLETEESAPNMMTTYKMLTQKIQEFVVKPNSKSPYHRKTSREWFDHECIASRKSLIHSFICHKDNPTEDNRQKMLEVKRSYKKLLTQKKRYAMKLLWQQLIEASNSSNPSLFWRIVAVQPDRGLSQLSCCISMKAWETHFHNLYEESSDESYALDIPEDQIQPWPAVSITETHLLIDQLKNGN
ncbi:Hypothetical predicted protein [Podarcis lilfordi]|uniref:Endonuclease/exonuclease/phosphatase domain-containing protein n=1 Tax=Podarcis lilfordi TaxID=74358 RepID=A0AA35K226_9SAUR|nr:Hypothetical predicted protein [Podarcis lilfordi]